MNDLSKHELVQLAAKAKAGMHKFKHEHGTWIKRVGIIFASSAVTTGVGVGLGFLELKMPRIPKTRVRLDSLGALALTAVNASGVMGEAMFVTQSAADAMNGHSFGRYGEEFFAKHGVRRTARP